MVGCKINVVLYVNVSGSVLLYVYLSFFLSFYILPCLSLSLSLFLPGYMCISVYLHLNLPLTIHYVIQTFFMSANTSSRQGQEKTLVKL